MELFRYLTSLMLLLCTTCVPICPVSSTLPPAIAEESIISSKTTIDLSSILAFLENIESGVYCKDTSFEDVTKINHYLLYLAYCGRYGISNSVWPEYFLAGVSLNHERVFIEPAIYLDDPSFYVSRISLKECWENTKKFVKEHKTEIIVGAVVLVVGTTVIIATAGTATPAVAAVVAGGSQICQEESVNTTFPDKIEDSLVTGVFLADEEADFKEIDEFSSTEFSKGFAKGLPKGVYDSGADVVRLASDLATHPIDTGQKIYDSFVFLSELASNDQWEEVGKVIAPEIHTLVLEWDSLTSKEKGQLAGYAIGKYGTDILIPGTVGKFSAKGLKKAGKFQKIEKKLSFESFSSAQTKVEFGSNRAGKIVFTEHAVQRAIERGVPKKAIYEAIETPLKIESIKIDHLGRPSQRFIGTSAEVVLNPETKKIISVNPTSSKKLKKLANRKSNVKCD